MFFFQPAGEKTKFPPTNILLNTLLKVFAANFNFRPGLKKYLKSDLGWINFSIGFRTDSGSVSSAVIFKRRQGLRVKNNCLKRRGHHADICHSDNAMSSNSWAPRRQNRFFMVLKGAVKPHRQSIVS